MTAQRRPILVDEIDLLIRAISRARSATDFGLIAWVILPDHFHAVLDCPNGDTPQFMFQVKQSFSLRWRRRTKSSGPVWQRRYWDHVIRSRADLERHIDYIHLNPVKHDYVSRVQDWILSSFHTIGAWHGPSVVPDLPAVHDLFGE